MHKNTGIRPAKPSGETVFYNLCQKCDRYSFSKSVDRSLGYAEIKLYHPSRNGRVVKCAVLRHGMLWLRVPAQAIGSSPGSDLSSTNACGYFLQLQVYG